MVLYNMYGINNSNNISKIAKKTNIMSNELEKIIEEVKNRVEREVPDTGYFRKISESYKNNDKDINAKAIALSVGHDPSVDGYGRLVLAILHPTQPSDLSVTLMRGNRQEILDYIKKEDFMTEVKNELASLSDSMKKYL